MKTPRIGVSLWPLLVVGLVTLAPCIAHAGLTGDTVNASLIEQDTLTSIFTTGSAVVGAGPEFTGTFLGDALSTWTLDLTDTGFTLTGVCSDDIAGCDFFSPPSGLTLSISDLDFTPPANLVALSGISGLLAADAGAPQITASSVVIEFQDVEMGSGPPLTQTYSATFVTDPPQAQAAPLPATVVLLAIGALAVTRWRSRSRI